MNSSKNPKRRLTSNLLRFLILSALGIMVIFPFYIMLMESLHPNLISLPYPVKLLPKFFSFSNYSYLFKSYPIVKWIINSIIISIGTSVFQIITCSMAAFGFSRTKFMFRDQLYWMIMLMLVVPIQTRILPLFIFMSHVKWVNTFLSWIPFASDAFGIFLLRQYMESIPFNFDEAARIDGAGLGIIYLKIIMPQITPAIVVLLTFNFITQWNDFLYPLIVIKDNSMFTLQIGLANIFSSAMRGEGGGMGVALAGSVVSFLPTLLIYLIFQKRVVEGMNYSAGIKG